MARALAAVFVLAGAVAVAVGIALVYRPAGVIAAGLEAVLAGFLIDDGEDMRESSAARPLPRRR